jgi:peroxiredoxin
MRMRTAVMWVIGGLAWTGVAQAQLKLGEPVPMSTAKMKNVDGREVSIAEVAGKNGTLVIFSCNHCPFVKAWETRIAALGNAYSKKGIGVICINSNDPKQKPEDSFEQMQQRAKQRGFQFPYTVDAGSEVARAFGATRTPEVFLFDKHGRLVYHGAIDDNHKSAEQVKQHYLRDALEALLAGNEIAVKQTRALGCTIKWYPKP